VAVSQTDPYRVGDTAGKFVAFLAGSVRHWGFSLGRKNQLITWSESPRKSGLLLLKSFEGSSMRFSDIDPCPQKRDLLYDYVCALDAHNKDLAEFSKVAVIGGDDSLAMRKRAETSLETCHLARKRYSDHVDEHGC
jgi:hypothetical protein